MYSTALKVTTRKRYELKEIEAWRRFGSYPTKVGACQNVVGQTEVHVNCSFMPLFTFFSIHRKGIQHSPQTKFTSLSATHRPLITMLTNSQC